MKRAFIGLALIAAAFLAGTKANAQFVLVKSVLGNGGSEMSNSTFTLNGTVGQAVIGLIGDATFTHGIGFWYPADKASGVEVITGYSYAGNLLYQNFPNPYRGSTTIRFHIAQRADVTLKVFSMPGEEVATVVNETMEAGDHEAVVDQQLPSGTYFYQLQVDNHVLRRQMVVTR
ncbi:MAG: T9SS type A sorting domain-containing protein [Bacteroidetes bacterium]|nr:T9SS type A sorting domain-containing protein [Bacteroidota bacterium]